MKRIILSTIIFCCAFGIALAQQKTEQLKISILGDSYSTYEGYLANDTNAVWYFKADNPKRNKHNDVTSVEQTWWYQVISAMNAKLELNNSFSGATICYCGYKKGPEPRVKLEGLEAYADYSNRSFATRSNKLGNPDVILICGATNDSWADAPIGEYIYGSQTNEDMHYFRPAMGKLLADLRANYPTARLLFILNTDLKEVINESVHTICAHYDVPCLDLKDIEKQHGHPSVKGMKSFAEQVIKKLSSK